MSTRDLITSRTKSLAGHRFGRLWVVSFAGYNRHRQSIWNCVCDCGKSKAVRSLTLKNGDSTSCGCRQREVVAKRSTTHGFASRDRKTPTYIAWSAMIRRCENKNTKDYPDYGGRGIKVCVRWRHSFLFFVADMGSRPSPKHSLDRYPDNNGDYEPGNCRWATIKEQTRNARSNRIVRHLDRDMTIGELAEITGLNYFVLYGRIIRQHWTVARAISTPIKGRSQASP